MDYTVNTLSIGTILFPSMNSSLRGISADVFFNGCKRHCPGCHNKELQEFTKPNHSISDILAVIKATNTKIVTFMGGEPLDQPIDDFRKLLTAIHKEFPDVILSLYTGYELPQVPHEILELLSDIKTGRYVEELHSAPGSFLASTNQKYYQKDNNGDWVLKK